MSQKPNSFDNYIILKSSSPNRLSKAVNEMILEGWIPTGGVAADNLDYFQAMIKTNSTNLSGRKDENENS